MIYKNRKHIIIIIIINLNFQFSISFCSDDFFRRKEKCFSYYDTIVYSEILDSAIDDSYNSFLSLYPQSITDY